MQILTLCGLLALCGCAANPTEEGTRTRPQEYLYVFPDGSMEFNGRPIGADDVVIYKDGRGGERAAVRLMLPLHPDVYRDTIIVERTSRDIPVVRAADG